MNQTNNAVIEENIETSAKTTENAPAKLEKISELDKSVRDKIIFVGKDVNFKVVEEFLRDNAAVEDFLVDGKLWATLDNKLAAAFDKADLKLWVEHAGRISKQRRQARFMQQHGIRIGKGKSSKNQVSAGAEALRKRKQKATKVARRKNR